MPRATHNQRVFYHTQHETDTHINYSGPTCEYPISSCNEPSHRQCHVCGEKLESHWTQDNREGQVWECENKDCTLGQLARAERKANREIDGLAMWMAGATLPKDRKDLFYERDQRLKREWNEFIRHDRQEHPVDTQPRETPNPTGTWYCKEMNTYEKWGFTSYSFVTHSILHFSHEFISDPNNDYLTLEEAIVLLKQKHPTADVAIPTDITMIKVD